MLRTMLVAVAALCCALPAFAVQLRPYHVDPDFKEPLGRLAGGLYMSLAGPGLIGEKARLSGAPRLDEDPLRLSPSAGWRDKRRYRARRAR